MKYDSIYRGIVIQNNDPSGQGRVKVFVPSVNINLLKDWNENKTEDKKITHLGSNTETSLTPDIIQRLKEKLKWADVMFPIVGMSTPAYYDAPKNISYIGSDSDSLSQQDNKTPQAFQKDANDASTRKNNTPTFTSSYSQPRTEINLNFKVSGQKYCVSTNNCSENMNIPSFPGLWKPSFTNKCLTKPVISLPKTFSNVDSLSSTSASSSIDNSDKNTTINYIQINVSNPDIFVNDKLVDKANPVYNTCTPIISYPSSVAFNPPILFQKTNDAIKFPTVSNLPVIISINGKDTLNMPFNIGNNANGNITYVNNNIKVVFPKSSVDSITVFNTDANDTSILNKIKALLPFLTLISNFSNIIMPRAPMTQGQPMISRGGGGGEIYNNVSTKLLPEDKRKNSFVGGANNESKENINRGRTAKNDEKKTKGSNLQGSVKNPRPAVANDYNNDYKGLISIPAPGAHVYVRFENGDSNFPIVIGTYTSKSDMKGLFDHINPSGK